MNCATHKRAILFDFDGVLVDSARLKSELFVSFYADCTTAIRTAIREYCDVHGGVPRAQKFRHIQTQILRKPLTDSDYDRLCREFATRIIPQVIQAPFIGGAKEFLGRYRGQFKLFVISGTQQPELRSICQIRGLTGCFVEIIGAPTSKSEGINEIIYDHQLAPKDAVMIGDSLTDYHAALETGVDFIGVQQPGRRTLPESAGTIEDLHELPAALENRFPVTNLLCLT